MQASRRGGSADSEMAEVTTSPEARVPSPTVMMLQLPTIANASAKPGDISVEYEVGGVTQTATDAAEPGVLTIRSAGEPRELHVREGEWSGWLKVKFKIGPLQAAHGIVRFRAVTEPV